MHQRPRDLLYRRHRFPAEMIGHAVWLYLRFPLSLRMVEDLLAARGITWFELNVIACLT
jgi:putative transposase